jgi:hypothetical protein
MQQQIQWATVTGNGRGAAPIGDVVPAIVIFTKAGKKNITKLLRATFPDLVAAVPMSTTKEGIETAASRVVVHCKAADVHLLHATIPDLKRQNVRVEKFAPQGGRSRQAGKADKARTGTANALDKAMRTGTCRYYQAGEVCPHGVDCRFRCYH